MKMYIKVKFVNIYLYETKKIQEKLIVFVKLQFIQLQKFTYKNSYKLDVVKLLLIFLLLYALVFVSKTAFMHKTFKLTSFFKLTVIVIGKDTNVKKVENYYVVFIIGLNFFVYNKVL